MKKLTKKIASLALAVTLIAAGSHFSVEAAQSAELSNGTYKATIHFHNGNNPEKYSMCDSIFAHEADVELTETQAIITGYVAYPIPSYPNEGVDGTIKDATITYNQAEYVATTDITTKAVKTFDTNGAMFGITAGSQLQTEAFTFTLPRESVEAFESGFPTSAYVNVVMNTTQNFIVKLTDLQLLSSNSVAEQPNATDSTSKDLTVTAEVVAPKASYIVTIPEAVELGTLSAEEDNSFAYEISVEAKNLGTGYVQITTPLSGNLISGDNKLAFANNFGTQKTSESKTFNGTLSVKASDVEKASAGNYTGTANFVIHYFAAK